VWSTSIASLFIFYEFLSQSPIVYNFFNGFLSNRGPSSELSGFNPSFRAEMLRVQGGFAQPIFAGFYLCCASFMGLILSYINSGYKKVAYFLSCGWLFVVSLFPLARGAFIGFIGALLFFLLLIKRISRWKIFFWVGILAILIWVASHYWEEVQGFWVNFILAVVGKASVNVQSEQLLNWEGRVEMIQKGIDLMLKGPLLGYGDISFGGAWIIRDICNVFIQVALQAGILGLILLITFLIFIFMQWLQLWKREKEKKRAVLAVGLIGCYVIVLASWMGSSWPGQFTQIGWFIFGLIYGMNLSHRKLISSEYVSDPNKWTR